MNFLKAFFLLLSLSVAVASQKDGTPVLIFAGDVTLARHIETSVGDKFDYIFEKWTSLRPYDVFMVNLENPVTTSEDKVEKEFNFRMHPKYLRVLKNGGVNLVNVANNHIADYNLGGVFDTMRYLDSADIRYVGIGNTLSEARTPVITTVRGKKIGFLGYHGGKSFAATSTRVGIAPRYDGWIVNDVKKLKKKVDLVVVNFHWGEERAEYPDQWQIELAHSVVDAGADLIIGHHPHVLQGVERYKGATIAYSLGNFVFFGNAIHTYDTAVLRVILTDGLPQVELVPVFVERWQPRAAEGERAQKIRARVRERSSIFQESLWQHVVPAKATPITNEN